MKIRFRFLIVLFIVQCSNSTIYCLAQDEIDVVDPYEMKVSRSKEADTFYFSQKAMKQTIKQRLDTLRTYDVFLEERPTPFGKAYMCNGTEITRQKYNEYKLLWNASSACKPCMLYTYDDKEQLKHVAFQYEDCLCGHYSEYYPEGGKKLEGQFRENTNGNWQNLKSRDICNVREGLWIYHFPNGAVEKTETYENGKLKSVANFTSNSSLSTKKTNTVTESTNGEETPKKGFIQRMKDKNKPNDY